MCTTTTFDALGCAVQSKHGYPRTTGSFARRYNGSSSDGGPSGMCTAVTAAISATATSQQKPLPTPTINVQCKRDPATQRRQATQASGVRRREYARVDVEVWLSAFPARARGVAPRRAPRVCGEQVYSCGRSRRPPPYHPRLKLGEKANPKGKHLTAHPNRARQRPPAPSLCHLGWY